MTNHMCNFLVCILNIVTIYMFPKSESKVFDSTDVLVLKV